MVAVGLEVGLSTDSKMIFLASVTVAVVLRLDNLDEFTVVPQLWHWHVFRVALHNVWWQSGDIVQSFTLAGDGVFHGLEHCVALFMLRQLVVFAVDEILSLSVDLELADDGLQLIRFFVGDGSIDDQ